MHTIRCEHCGREFLSDRANRKYCSYECKEAVKKAQRRDYNKKRRKKTDKKTDKCRTSLTDINRIARETGMSYGQYVAQQYIENMRRRA